MTEPFEREPLEADRRWSLDRELSHLVDNARDEVLKLRSAIALIDWSFEQSDALAHKRDKDWINAPAALRRDQQIVRDWSRFGAHSAIGTLYQFQDTLSAMVAWVSGHPHEVRNFTDATTAQKALDLFIRHFPKWEQTRHATAHSSEIRRNAKKNAHMGKLSRGLVQKPKGIGLTYGDTFINRVFTTTRKGEILEFDTTWSSYIKLLEVHDLAISGFATWIGPRPTDQNARQS